MNNRYIKTRRIYTSVIAILIILLIVIVVAIRTKTEQDLGTKMLELFFTLSIALIGQVCFDFLFQKINQDRDVEQLEKIKETITTNINPKIIGNKVDSNYEEVNELKKINYDFGKSNEETIQMKFMFIGFDFTFLNMDFMKNIIDYSHKRKLQLDLLLMNPCCDNVLVRAKSTSTEDYLEKVYHNHKKLLEFLKVQEIGHSVKIKYYDVMPPAVIMKIENSVWFTSLWNHLDSKYSAWFCIDDRCDVTYADQLHQGFIHLWNTNSIPVDKVNQLAILKDKNSYIQYMLSQPISKK